MKRFLRGFLSIVFVLGVAIALWPLAQRAYGVWSQRNLQAQWQSTTHRPKSKVKSAKSKVQSPTLKVARNSQPATHNSQWPLTRLVIPDIQLEAVVVQGLDEKALARGPGHDPRSALPGIAGNCVIAGHRNVYGAWFYRLDELWAGSQIRLETSDATHTYEVLAVQTVAESDSSVLQPPANKNVARLTLITCTLPHTPNRIIVVAERVEDTQ